VDAHPRKPLAGPSAARSGLWLERAVDDPQLVDPSPELFGQFRISRAEGEVVPAATDVEQAAAAAADQRAVEPRGIQEQLRVCAATDLAGTKRRLS
jgi:hypothetical protein